MHPSRPPTRPPVACLSGSGHILSAFGRQQSIRRDIILTTSRQILLAVVLCVGVRRSDTPNASVADSERTSWRTEAISSEAMRQSVRHTDTA